jgi:hypothetical protein
LPASDPERSLIAPAPFDCARPSALALCDGMAKSYLIHLDLTGQSTFNTHVEVTNTVRLGTCSAVVRRKCASLLNPTEIARPHKR